MASKDYWINPAELSDLGAELAGHAPPARDAHAADDGPIDLFDFSAEPPVPPGEATMAVGRVGVQLAAIKQRAVESGILRTGSPDSPPGNPALPVAGPPPGSGATLVERLEDFITWASSQDVLAGLFISDFCGNELVDSGAEQALVSSGVALADGWRRAREELESPASNGVSTAASVRDAEGAVLTVFSCRSAYGNHVLGTLSAQPLPASTSLGLRSGLARVMGI